MYTMTILPIGRTAGVRDVVRHLKKLLLEKSNRMRAKLLILTLLVFICTDVIYGQKKVNQFRNGDLRLDIKLPHINWLTFNPEKNFRDAEIGFNGYGIGLEYNYKDKKILETSTSFVMTFEFPIPIPLDAEYNKILTSTYLNLTDNVILKRFTVGYGLNYSLNTWKEWYRQGAIGLPINKKTLSNRKLGLTINSYYRIRRTFNMGIIYQPSIINLTENRISYEHLVSLELNWRIKLLKIR